MTRSVLSVPALSSNRAPLAAGLLSGLTFAVKDLFDVAGDVTGCGNPDWAASHAPASFDAWAVDALRQAGASLHGKTITDEISLGLLGINRHYGTPINLRAPSCVPWRLVERLGFGGGGRPRRLRPRDRLRRFCSRPVEASAASLVCGRPTAGSPCRAS